MVRSSKDNNEGMKDLRANKELNLKEFKEYDIHFHPEENKEDTLSNSQKDQIHFISDGRPQSLQRSKSPKIMEQMLLKTVIFLSPFSNVYTTPTNLLLKIQKSPLKVPQKI